MLSFALVLVGSWLLLSHALNVSTDNDYDGDVAQAFKLTIRSPDVLLLHDDVIICASIDFPDEWGTSYIVDFKAKVVPGADYFIGSMVCNDAGHRSVTGAQESGWNCGSTNDLNGEQGLVQAPICDPTVGNAYGVLRYEYHAGVKDQGVFRLPPGTGVPVGGRTGRKSLVAVFHYTRVSQMMDGRTGVSELEVSLIQSPVLQTVSQVIFNAVGFVGPQSVGSVTGVTNFTRDIHPVLLYTHTHGHSVDFQVAVLHQADDDVVVIPQDPRRLGFYAISDWPSTVIRLGDQLEIQCTNNNSRTNALKVDDGDTRRCGIYLFYTTDDQEINDEPVHVSVDARSKDCFAEVTPNNGFIMNYEGKNSFQGPVTPADCDALAVEATHA